MRHDPDVRPGRLPPLGYFAAPRRPDGCSAADLHGAGGGLDRHDFPLIVFHVGPGRAPSYKGGYGVRSIRGVFGADASHEVTRSRRPSLAENAAVTWVWGPYQDRFPAAGTPLSLFVGALPMTRSRAWGTCYE